MINVIVAFSLICFGLAAYVYVGYPALLFVLSKTLRAKHVDKAATTPSVTMIVSCYNESDVIEEKIQNCLAIGYPVDKLNFVFVSDGSDDGTDEIIKGYTGDRIKLVRQEGRLGKTMGLNLAMESIPSEIVVFSDANAIYAEDSVKKLVQSFNDPEVGYVVGAALYTDASDSAAAASEDLYWRYEIWLKTIESNLHSVVGGDGAIYATRRALYTPLDAKDINDFVNPLQIIAKGYRGIFEPEAKCYEETAGDYDKEGNRKERIVNRSFRGLMQVKSVLNPMEVGLYALEIWSHKLLRWLVPFFIIGGTAGSLIATANSICFFQLITAGEIGFFTLALLGYRREGGSMPVFLSIPYYFTLVNYRSMRGVMQYFSGHTQVTWSSSRSQNESDSVNRKVKVKLYSILILALMSWILLASL